MATWRSENFMLTMTGREILSKIQAGIGALTISRIVTGGGYVAASRLYEQTAVTDIKQELSLVNIDTTSEGSSIEVQCNNEDLEEAYTMYQIGIYVTHPDYEGEQLYWIGQCDIDTADQIPLPSDLPLAMNFMVFVEHAEVDQVTITVNPVGSVPITTFNAYKTEVENEFTEVRAEIDSDIEAHNVAANAHYDYTGATTSVAGKRGFVPASPKLVANKDVFLCSDGTWKEGGKVNTVNGIAPDDVNKNIQLPAAFELAASNVIDSSRILSSGTDLNNLTTANTYICTSANTGSIVNKPSGFTSGAFRLIVAGSASENLSQILMSGDKIYMRSYSGSSWTTWVQFLDTADKGASKGLAVLDSKKHLVSSQYDFATKSEVTAGTNTTKPINSAVVKQAINSLVSADGIVDSLLAQNGYVKFANGLIVQWLRTSRPLNRGSSSFNYPISFTSACFCGSADCTNVPSGGVGNVALTALNISSGTVYGDYSDDQQGSNTALIILIGV